MPDLIGWEINLIGKTLEEVGYTSMQFADLIVKLVQS
jgi:hypothetical protein